MSQLLSLTNHLKAQANLNLLTPGQQQALAELESRWQFPDRLNLAGPPGSGKTFLAWTLARQHQAHFYAAPRQLGLEPPPYPLDVVIDNAPTEEKEVRRLLAELQLRQTRRLLLITRQPIRLGLPIIGLPAPTEADIAVVYDNCSRLQFYPAALRDWPGYPVAREVETPDFWQVIYSVL